MRDEASHTEQRDVVFKKLMGCLDIAKHGPGWQKHLNSDNIVTGLGKGVAIFDRLGEWQQLKLVTAKTFDCGIVLLHYERL